MNPETYLYLALTAIYFWVAGDCYRALRDSNERLDKRMKVAFPDYESSHFLETFALSLFWLPVFIVSVLIGLIMLTFEGMKK